MGAAIHLENPRDEAQHPTWVPYQAGDKAIAHLIGEENGFQRDEIDELAYYRVADMKQARQAGAKLEAGWTSERYTTMLDILESEPEFCVYIAW